MSKSASAVAHGEIRFQVDPSEGARVPRALGALDGEPLEFFGRTADQPLN